MEAENIDVNLQQGTSASPDEQEQTRYPWKIYQPKTKIFSRLFIVRVERVVSSIQSIILP